MLHGQSSAALLLFVTTLTLPYTGMTCGSRYVYVNTGDVFSGGDEQVHIACLETDGCELIEYLHSSCNGCDDPTCTLANGKRINFTQIPFSEVIQIDQGSDISTIENGDIICSKNQVNVASRLSLGLTDAHEWAPASLAGTKFAYMSPRGLQTECLLYSFEGSEVTIQSQGVNEETFLLSAYQHVLKGTYATRIVPLKIFSDTPIVVSCYEESNDFSNLSPLYEGNVYGYNSQTTRGVQLDCETLDTTLNISHFPICEYSSGQPASITVSSDENHFRIGDTGISLYQGDAIICKPKYGSCIALYTFGDGDGREGTTWIRGTQFSEQFVIPHPAKNFVIASNGSDSNCIFRDEAGNLLSNVTTDGGSLLVKKASEFTTYDKGTSIRCTDPVSVIASFADGEFTLHGREDAGIWSYALGLGETTCTPTFSPSQQLQPSQSPTLFPSTHVPTDSPTKGPTEHPTKRPTKGPTEHPTNIPSYTPTSVPSNSPNNSPTTFPVHLPTRSPSTTPSHSPTSSPISKPAESPSRSPSRAPSPSPTISPSITPNIEPSFSPSLSPSYSPSKIPSLSPVAVFSGYPTLSPLSPTSLPSNVPSTSPITLPSTGIPSASPLQNDPEGFNKTGAVPTSLSSYAPYISVTGFLAILLILVGLHRYRQKLESEKATQLLSEGSDDQFAQTNLEKEIAQDSDNEAEESIGRASPIQFIKKQGIISRLRRPMKLSMSYAKSVRSSLNAKAKDKTQRNEGASGNDKEFDYDDMLQAFASNKRTAGSGFEVDIDLEKFL